MVKVKCQYCGNEYEVLNEFEAISSICPKCGWEQDEHITEEWDYSDVNRSSIRDYVPIPMKDGEDL